MKRDLSSTSCRGPDGEPRLFDHSLALAGAAAAIKHPAHFRGRNPMKLNLSTYLTGFIAF
jgi:hypothetical protein